MRTAWMFLRDMWRTIAAMCVILALMTAATFILEPPADGDRAQAAPRAEEVPAFSASQPDETADALNPR
jgi:hypothetical protein